MTYEVRWTETVTYWKRAVVEAPTMRDVRVQIEAPEFIEIAATGGATDAKVYHIKKTEAEPCEVDVFLDAWEDGHEEADE